MSKQYKVPRKLINLVQDTLQQTEVQVNINNDVTEQSEITSGEKQGDPLSALLFSIVVDVIISELEATGNISTRLQQISAHADVFIIGRAKQMIDTFIELKSEASKYGLLEGRRNARNRHCEFRISAILQVLWASC
jgi:hypothetical protein